MRCFLSMTMVLCLMACESSRRVEPRVNPNDSADELVQYYGDDEEMNIAIGQARTTFPQFLEKLKTECEDCRDFTVKLRFDINEIDGEHIWLNELHFRKGKLFGLLANEPEAQIGIKFGDTVAIEPAKLSDWMYIRNGNLAGGYTLKVIYNHLSEREKKELEDQVGAKIR